MSNFQKFMKFETSTALETFSKNMTSYVNRDSLSVKCDCYTHHNGEGCKDSHKNTGHIVRPTRFGFRLKMNDHKNGFVIYNPELYHKSGQRLGAGYWRNTTCDCDIHDDATNEKVANMHFCLDNKGAVHNLQLQHEHDNDLHSHEYIDEHHELYGHSNNALLDCSSLGVTDTFNGKSYQHNGHTYCCASGSFHSGTSETDPSGCLDRSQVCTIDNTSNSCDIIPCYVADMSTPRSYFGLATLNDYLYALGGTDTSINVARDMDYYEPSSNSWGVSTGLRAAQGLAVVSALSSSGEPVIYTFGGFDSSRNPHFLHIATTYHPGTDFIDISYIHTGRAWFGACATDKTLFALGGMIDISGEHDAVLTASCEAYDIATNTWTYISPMTTKRSHFSAAALNGKAYAVGGYDGINYLNSGIVYTPGNNSWAYIADMSSVRLGAGVTALNGKLYAVGGYDGKNTLSSGEVYDPVTNKWLPIANMSIARHGASLAVLNGKIYAAGGSNYPVNMSIDSLLEDNSKYALKVVEVYDPVIDKWSNVHAPPQKLTYNVTVAAFNNGSEKVYVIEGIPKNSLTLQVGKQYTFTYPEDHPLHFSEASDGGHNHNTDYTLGIARTPSKNKVVIAVLDSTPKTLYYYCLHHSGMGGTINITP